MDFEEFIKNGHQHFLPNLSVDHVIFGYQNDQLMCLLLQIGNKWLLPGGHILREESVEVAAQRILKDRTNLDRPYLRFHSVFGHPDRKFVDQWKEILPKFQMDWDESNWLNDRFVTLAYYSLVDMQHVSITTGEGFESLEWFPFDNLPPMWLDHQEIAMSARIRLKSDIKADVIAYHLLSSEFTMPELHQLQQVILEEEIDRSRFQKNMLASDVFERLPQRNNESRGRNPYQYRVHKKP